MSGVVSYGQARAFHEDIETELAQIQYRLKAGAISDEGAADKLRRLADRLVDPDRYSYVRP